MSEKGFSYFMLAVFTLVVTIFLTACNNEAPLETLSLCGYQLPWSGRQGEIGVSQSYTGAYSHHKGTQSEFAVDFSLPEGTEVLAARGGIVSRLQDGKTACGGKKFIGEANYVVIDHGDGTSALYLHLQGVTVDKGQKVSQGQLIGYSGKTGYTNCDPHLHFQVQETTNSWFSQSVRVCFVNVPENEGVPYRGMILAPGEEIMEVSGEAIPATLIPPLPTTTETPSSGLPDLGGRVVVIVVSNAIPPYKNKWDGWDHETVARVCELVNCTPVFKELPWEEAYLTLTNGTSERLGFSITIIPERQAIWDFAIPYANLSGAELVSFAFPKGSDLVQPVNVALKYMLESGEMSGLTAKWGIPDAGISP